MSKQSKKCLVNEVRKVLLCVCVCVFVRVRAYVCVCVCFRAYSEVERTFTNFWLWKSRVFSANLNVRTPLSEKQPMGIAQNTLS